MRKTSMRCWSKRLAAAGLLLLACPQWLSPQSNPILSVKKPGGLVARRNTDLKVELPVALLPGYHINSSKPGEAYLIPLELKWTSKVLGPARVDYPPPQNEKYDFSAKPLSVYTGNFTITSLLPVLPEASSGPGILSGKLRYQACTKTTCFPPKTLDISLIVEVR